MKVKLAYDKNNAAKLTIKAAKHTNTFHTIGNLYWIGWATNLSLS